MTLEQMKTSAQPVRCEISLNGVKLTKLIPTRWAHVTFRTWLKLRDCGSNHVKIFATIVGIQEETLRKAKITNLDSILALLSFLMSPPDNSVPVKILGYDVPKDLGFESIGQYEDLHEDLRVQRTSDEQLLRFPLYCAIYACPSKHGQYDWQQAEAMADEFMDAPAGEVLAIGNFTLLKLIGLIKGTDPTSLNQAIHRKRLKPGSLVWLKLSAFMVRCFSLKRIFRIPATK